MNHSHLYVQTDGMGRFSGGLKEDICGYFVATAENIASLIVQCREAPHLEIGTLDELPLLTANYGFVFKMYDQDYHINHLLPLLSKMQLDDEQGIDVTLHSSVKDLVDVQMPVVDWNAYQPYIENSDWPEFHDMLLANAQLD